MNPTIDEFNTAFASIMSSEEFTGATEAEQDELLEEAVSSYPEAFWPSVVGITGIIVQKIRQWMGLTPPKPSLADYIADIIAQLYNWQLPWRVPSGGA